MTNHEISQRDIAALAAVVARARAIAGHSTWDEAGIAATIRKSTAPYPDLAVALIKASQNAAADTPAVVVNVAPWDDGYWRCPTHPENRSRRTDGECGACYADRTAAPVYEIPQRHGKPIPDEARQQIVAAIGGAR